MAEVKFPLGIQSFESIRYGGYFYVDKTSFVYELATGGKYFFLSRPRRFGKSLFTSTLEAYFEGKKDLFEGLSITQQEKDWISYPILHLDLNTEKYSSLEALDNKLHSTMRFWEQRYGVLVNDRQASLGIRFEDAIRNIAEKLGRPVVLLVDEYDKPLLQALGDKTLEDEFRATLKGFYGAVKSMDKYIRFAFFTGVTKFSKVSIFSDLNNLTDITMLRKYNEICGITEEELHDTMDIHVGRLAAANGMTKEQCYDRLKQDYDGYHFTEDSPGVYNPYSLLNTFSHLQFKDYWYETGTPTYLVELIQRYGYDLNQVTEEHVTSDVLNSINDTSMNPIPVLYQSGYLTIVGYNSEFELYKLGFPNRDVEKGFTQFLLPYYTSLNENNSVFTISLFVRDVRQGCPEQFMQRLQTLFADGDYQIAGKAELYFHNALYVLFKMMGFYVEVERVTSNGRMDMVVKTNNYIYLFEFKIDRSAKEALLQIEEKGYEDPFVMDSRKLFKIGVNFSSQTRGVESWLIV